MATVNDNATPSVVLDRADPEPVFRADEAPAPPLYRAGTLSYTRLGLVLLFFWLLWGHFLYALMERLPGLLPLLLREHKATNTEISFITTSLNLIGNMVFNPIISFWSDRHRGPRGRRRPFIIWTTPLVVVCLALIPFGPDIADALGRVSIVRSVLEWSPVIPAVLFIAVFVMGFQIFDVFVGVLSAYLARDTVPDDHLGRFFAWMRLAGTFASLIFSLFVFKHAETHMKAVFVGVAVVYGAGMYLMCWKVKEGQFPPPEPLPAGRSHWYLRLWGAVRLYVRDCFTHPLYWCCFLAQGLAAWSNASGVFAILFYRKELGVSMETLGHANAVNDIFTLVILVPLGYLVDRWNFFRLTQLSIALLGVVCVLGWLFMRDLPSMYAFFLIYAIPKAALSLALVRTVVAIYPKEKYGQFGSAGALVISVGAMGMSVFAARFVDAMGDYRSFLLWQGVLSILAGLLFVVLEMSWNKARRANFLPAVQNQ